MRSRFLTVISILALVLGPVYGNAPSPARSSPDGRYEWVINESSPVSYQLLDRMSHSVCFTIKCYFADSDGDLAIRYARGAGVYWNRDSNIVALDEPNYRRAGYLYFFSVEDGNVKPIDVRVPAPPDFDEARLCTDKAWTSVSQFSVRQAIKLKTGDFQSKSYIIDFAGEEGPRIELDNH